MLYAVLMNAATSLLGGMSPRWTSGFLALSPLVPPISIACANDSSLMEIHACACSNVPRITARSRSL